MGTVGRQKTSRHRCFQQLVGCAGRGGLCDRTLHESSRRSIPKPKFALGVFVDDPSDSRTVAGRNSICPFRLIWRSWGDLNISGGIFCVCRGAKVAGSYSTTASGSCNTQSLLLSCSCARRCTLAKTSTASASILELIVITCSQIVPRRAAIGNRILEVSDCQATRQLPGCSGYRHSHIPRLKHGEC